MSEPIQNPNPTPIEPVPTPAPNPTPSPEDIATNWKQSLSEDLKGYVENKGFKDPTAVVESYKNFEKLMGAPKERLITLPESLTDGEAMSEIYNKLGRPESASEYEFPSDMTEEVEDVFKNMFHEAGLSNRQANLLVEKINALSESENQTKQEAYESNLQTQEAGLKKEWGAAFDQNIQVAKNAANKFGMSGEQIDALEKAMGFDGVMKFLNNIGSKLGEHEFVGNSGGNGFAMTPEAAKHRIAELKKDPGFGKRYTSGDIDAKEEMERLHKFAYGN